MATVGPSFFQIPQNKIQQCLNSGVLTTLMIATAGIAIIVAQNAMGNLNANVGACIAAMPYFGPRLIARIIPEIDIAATSFGSAVGMGVAIMAGLTGYGYATGSLIGGLTASAVAAARVRVVPQE